MKNIGTDSHGLWKLGFKVAAISRVCRHKHTHTHTHQSKTFGESPILTQPTGLRHPDSLARQTPTAVAFLWLLKTPYK